MTGRMTRTMTRMDSKKVPRRERMQQNPRNPLKDLNSFPISNSLYTSGSSIASSTTATTTSTSTSSVTESIRDLRGRRRLFLSHYSSGSSRSPAYRPKSVTIAPNSAPNVRSLKPKLTDDAPKSNVQRNPHKSTGERLQKIRKNPPCVNHWQSRSKPSSQSNVSGRTADYVNKSSLGSKFLMQKKQQKVVVKRADDVGEAFHLTFSCKGKVDDGANITILTKLASDSGADTINGADEALKLGDENSNTSSTPPVQASISPEIKCGSSSLVLTTPACYGAGHIVSGVTDKRKCRPRGVLTVEDNDLLGFSKLQLSDNDGGKIAVNGVVDGHRTSLVPAPKEASLRWHSSPCDEKGDEHHTEGASYGLDPCPTSMGIKAFNLSSFPSCSHEFSSELSNNSNSTAAISDSTDATYNSWRTKTFHSSGIISEFQGFLGSSSDQLGSSSSEVSSPSMHIYKAAVSYEERKCHYNLVGETTPYSVDYYMGSGNAIQALQSNSSSDNRVVLSPISGEGISKIQFEGELDSMRESGRENLSPGNHVSTVDYLRMNFKHNHLTTAANFTECCEFWNVMASQNPCTSESVSPSLQESEVKISWEDGLFSQVSEMDELDCCRCFSDEEQDTNEDLEMKMTTKEKQGFPTQGLNDCAESISIDGGSLLASEDSEWMGCYKDLSFEV
ncbi:hypothetical protein Nepgr_010595 [Nepenthes gracilis]|uniref:Uncharacterized protein n=1 Tax=Nepenthes gracilis TaxID=150966 RepID=A0AAD3SDJ7_NEPGR|nr:hypothetical protein Nepgr_010595 [Nepenthes gracilis]